MIHGGLKMAYVPGTDYTGFFASDYETIVAGNEELAAWISANMSLVADGKYYVYNGEDQWELFDLFLDGGVENYVRYFTYLKSTWEVVVPW